MVPDDGHGSEEEGGPEDRAGSSWRGRRVAPRHQSDADLSDMPKQSSHLCCWGKCGP